VNEFETRTVHADELRFIIDQERPRIEGRAIVYNSLSEDLGGWREIIEPGAVVLEDDLRALFDHDTSMVLGRTKSGTLEARDDGAGIVMLAYPPDTTWAKDLRTSMDRGDIDQMSFRMYVEDEDWRIQDDEVVRFVKRALISELSVVSMPAYAATSAEARDKAAAVRDAAPITDNAVPDGASGSAPGTEGGAPSVQTETVFVDGIGFIQTQGKE